MSDEMGLRRFALVLLGVAAVALVSALPAASKEGVKATLTTRVPLDAPAGARLEVAWTLTYLDDRGRRQPFGAGDVFVRLRSASGSNARRGFAPRRAHSRGEYAATVVVPKGGIGDVEIGLRGWADGPHGRREADLLFPITNDPVPGAAQPFSERPDTGGSTTWIFLLVAGSLSTLAVFAVALVRRRNASGAGSPASDRRAPALRG